jgi:hypothetical protein
MMAKKYLIGFWITILGLGLSAGVILWGIWMPPPKKVHFELKPLLILPDAIVSGLSDRGIQAANNTTLIIPPELTGINLEYRDWIRLGETGEFQFSLDKGSEGAASAAGVPLQEITSLYNVMVEASLEISDVTVTPPGSLTQALLPGEGVKFAWKITPEKTGQFAGRLWLYLLFVPKDGGPVERAAVLARPIELTSTSFFGLPLAYAQWGGVAAFFLFLFLCFWIVRKRKVKRRKIR